MPSKLDSRCLRALKLLLSDQYMPLETIANEINVSAKTAKKDLAVISAFLREYRGSVIFRKGKGHQAIFESPQDRAYFINDILTPLLKVETFLPGKSLLRQIILNILLLSEDYISSDFIAEKLFISRSSVSQVSKAVQQMIESYHLKLHHRPHYGMKVIGRESDLRYAICDNHEFFGHDNDNSPLLGKLSAGYLQLYQQYNRLNYQRFQELLRQYNSHLYPAMLSKLSYLLIVIAARSRRGFALESDPSLSFLQGTDFYAMAQDLLKTMGIEETGEILWFAMFLFANSDTATILRAPQYQPYLAQAQAMDGVIRAYLETEKGLTMAPADDEGLSILARILITSQYHIKERFLSKEIFYLHKNDSFIYYISVGTAMLLHQQLGLGLSHDVFFSLGAYFKRLLDHLAYAVHPLSVALLCPYHPTAAEGIRRKMLRICAPWIKEIDIAHFVERSPAPPADLVFSLTQSNMVLQQDGEPVLFLDGNPGLEDYLLIFRHAFLTAAGIGHMLRPMEMKVIPHGMAKTKRDIFHMFCLFQKADIETSMGIMESLGEREKLTSFENKTANVILFIALNQEADRIHILKQARPFLWKSRRIQYFVFLGIDAKNRPEKLKLFKSIADILILQPELLSGFYDLLADGKQNEAIELLLRQGNYWF